MRPASMMAFLLLAICFLRVRSPVGELGHSGVLERYLQVAAAAAVTAAFEGLCFRHVQRRLVVRG